MLRGCYDETDDLSDVSLACYEKVGDKFRTCSEEVTRKLLPWNFAFNPDCLYSLHSFSQYRLSVLRLHTLDKDDAFPNIYRKCVP